jgi:hypothetical protein
MAWNFLSAERVEEGIGVGRRSLQFYVLTTFKKPLTAKIAKYAKKAVF